jgi:hypothetical protein
MCRRIIPLIIAFLIMSCNQNTDNEGFKIGTFVYLMDTNNKTLYSQPDYNSTEIETIWTPDDFVCVKGFEIVSLTGIHTESDGQWLQVNFYDLGYKNEIIKKEGFVTSNGLRKISVKKNLNFDALEGFYLDTIHNHLLHIWKADEYNLFQLKDGFSLTYINCKYGGGYADGGYSKIEGAAKYSNGKLVLTDYNQGWHWEFNVKDMNILSYSDENNPIALDCTNPDYSGKVLFYPISLHNNLALIVEDRQKKNGNSQDNYGSLDDSSYIPKGLSIPRSAFEWGNGDLHKFSRFQITLSNKTRESFKMVKYKLVIYNNRKEEVFLKSIEYNGVIKAGEVIQIPVNELSGFNMGYDIRNENNWGWGVKIENATKY